MEDGSAVFRWALCRSELCLVSELNKERVRWPGHLSGVGVRPQDNGKFLAVDPANAENQGADEEGVTGHTPGEHMNRASGNGFLGNHDSMKRSQMSLCFEAHNCEFSQVLKYSEPSRWSLTTYSSV